MYLIQILLPLYDNDGCSFDQTAFDKVRDELTERFGGVTAFVRSPAIGLWKESVNDVARDDVVMFEVLCEQLDHGWWKNYRSRLETTFRQQDLAMWAVEILKL